ncbi:MAG: molybdopterin-binding protein [Polaromonas sp.]|uniref:competence/damage-inducible protein A n=1 Tax=Polaromonas sp. TaxID=1869339 RepID=UPI0027305E60|nr:molybdopterin-binding protein [Polaromonas sp.]MDP2450764.1 molybdopterin-binding protein [Polaromonas sp.]MDP3250217.1 molybdopterin-binding protein [Polaromonas sp.]
MTTHFGLIIVGDEILSGKRADKHLPKVIELLAARGLPLSYADYVGDDPERITATLARAFAAARATGDVVFCTGGIGATPDDHTRQCAARALGVELALHPEAERLIRERMQDIAREQGVPYEPDRHDNIHRLNMGMFPAGAAIIPNPYNKIPGFSCFVDSSIQPGPRNGLSPAAGAAAPEGLTTAAPNLPAQVWTGGRADASGVGTYSDPHAVGERGGLHFMPGFPVMAWPMVEWLLDTHYVGLHQKLAYAEKSVIVMGSMEAALTPLMLTIEACHSGVKVFSLPSVDHPEYGRHIELGVKGAPDAVNAAYPALLAGLHTFNAKLGPELVR